ncbi:MAG TPA: cytochrome c maturation protein CcmE domain-containing protein, partial [Xylella sp.]
MNARRRRLLCVLILMLATGTATTLTIMALQRHLTYLYIPSEVLRGHASQQIHFRLGGIVEKGSFQRIPGTLESHFIVTDGNARLQVRYARILPDLFR